MIKKFLYLALVSILFTAIYSVFAYGKSVERKDQEIIRLEQLRKMAEEAQRIRDQDIRLMMEGIQGETRIIERIRTERIEVVTPDCTDLGVDWVREANKIMGTNP